MIPYKLRLVLILLGLLTGQRGAGEESGARPRHHRLPSAGSGTLKPTLLLLLIAHHHHVAAHHVVILAVHARPLLIHSSSMLESV